MQKLVGQLWNVATNAPTVWQIVLWVFPSAGAAVTAVYSHLENMPIAWAIFATSGVFFFLIAGLSHLAALRRSSSLLRKIRFGSLGIVGFTEVGATNVIQLVGAVENNADDEVYFQVVDASCVLENRTRQDANTMKKASIVPAKGNVGLHIPAISDVPDKPEVKGNLRLKISYGRNAERLNFTYEMNGSVYLAISQKDKEGSRKITCQLLYDEVKYS